MQHSLEQLKDFCTSKIHKYPKLKAKTGLIVKFFQKCNGFTKQLKNLPTNNQCRENLQQANDYLRLLDQFSRNMSLNGDGEPYQQSKLSGQSVSTTMEQSKILKQIGISRQSGIIDALM